MVSFVVGENYIFSLSLGAIEAFIKVFHLSLACGNWTVVFGVKPFHGGAHDLRT